MSRLPLVKRKEYLMNPKRIVSAIILVLLLGLLLGITGQANAQPHSAANAATSSANPAAPALCNPIGFSNATSYPAGSGPSSVAVGDFNHDGKPDLATANYSSNNVSALLGNGNGTFQTAANFSVGSQPFSVAVGDF
ncbi:MAG: hypothetical protein DLM69_06005, partial [Candidatus Chloroheliales bacterium]